ncbi:MAG: hypothetical protein E4H36_09000 [Spirochaetales bacterium]|nr:MAG: hypothetical protein E4H36_09000 [Spirochaetales bacterium]
MQEQSAFDRLVETLNGTERRELLSKLSAPAGNFTESLASGEVPRAEPVDISGAYHTSGFWIRIVIFIKSLLTGKDRLELFEEELLSVIAKDVERNYPGLIDYRMREFLPAFFEELDTLKTAAEALAVPLEQSYVLFRDDFIAFLAGIFLDYSQERLMNVTDPNRLAAGEKSGDEKEIRENLDLKLEEVILDIPKEERGRMFEQSKALFLLKEIVFFPYGECLKKSYGMLSLGDLETALKRLASLLRSFRVPPDRRTMNALFLFYFREELQEEDSGVEEKLKRLLDKSAGFVHRIKDFNRKIPLEKLLKLLTRDINFEPEIIKGGEDWFVLYKQFWKRRLSQVLSVFFSRRKKKQLYREAAALVKLEDLPELKFYNSRTNEYGVSFTYEYSLSFILAFLKNEFNPEMNQLLKLILIDGQFYKEENRNEFTDAYNGMLRLSDQLEALDQSLSPEGTFGRSLAQTAKEIVSLPLRKKRLSSILTAPEKDALDITDRMLKFGDSLMKVVYGILYGEVGGKYDTLSNRVHLGGKENRNILKSLAGMLEKLSVIVKLLKEIIKSEKKTNV